MTPTLCPICLKRSVENCDCLAKAEENRVRIFNNAWWLWYEFVSKHTPLGETMPNNIPQGELPQVGKKVVREIISEMEDTNGSERQKAS